jgi:hypothetical protein
MVTAYCTGQAYRAWLIAGILMFAEISLSGCANLQTVNRTTSFGGDGKGRAIHLDAQQRLVITNGMKFCAEPSPDALASYASALGFGAAGGRNSASIAAALEGSAGSIGLRTQSITLMRDALYRMCEAKLNGSISGLSAATFLTRSQDLTAVVLAIEQLTGAVAAPPIVLGGSSSANSSALLLSNQQMLVQAKKDEERAKEAFENAKKLLEGSVALVEPKAAELKQASDEMAALEASATATDEQKAAAKARVATLEAELKSLQDDVAAKESGMNVAKQSLAEATKNREAIEAQRDSSYTSVAASTTGGGQIGETVRGGPMDAGAAKEIAAAVSTMVDKVLGKSYTTETCMAFLTTDEPFPGYFKTQEFISLRSVCIQLVTAELDKQKASAERDARILRSEK